MTKEQPVTVRLTDAAREGLAGRYPEIIAAPKEYLDEAYRGEREISDCGVVLLRNGDAIFYKLLMIRHTPTGSSFAYLEVPEVHVGPDDYLVALTKIGGFVLFRGYGKDVEIKDNPEKKEKGARDLAEKTIAEKARSALMAVGIHDDEEDDF